MTTNSEAPAPMSDDDDEVFEWAWPTGAGADHIHAKQQELEGLLAARVPVFLDTNFWVMARQAATGESDDPKLISLLGAMRMAVGSGKAIFPLTSDLIAEFSKQSADRLGDTMMMVDLLSLGVVMIPHHERVAREVETFVGRCYPDSPPRRRPLWTSYAFALGYEDLHPPGMVLNDAMLVKMAEMAWMTQPSLLARGLDPSLFDAKARSQQTADLLNEQEALHAHEIDSHKTAVAIEIAGGASLIQGVAAREYRRLAKVAGHTFEASDIANSHAVGGRIAAMVGKAMLLDANRLQFASLYVPAMLHATSRAIANRKLRANDIFDFKHAAAALPHCRAFFTDGPLKTMIESGHVRLDRDFDCRVAATAAEAIAILMELTL